MSNIQIESVIAPLDDPAIANRALRLLCRAEALGVFRPDHSISQLSPDVMRSLWQQLGKTQIARGPVVKLLLMEPGPGAKEEYAHLLEDVFTKLGESPTPETEWRPLLSIFEAEQLADLLNISISSLHRYATGRRSTPDEVAARLHYLSLVVDALSGAYNAFGIRRWFERPRHQLDGKSPRMLLAGEWDPDDPDPQRVRALAESLTSMTAS